MAGYRNYSSVAKGLLRQLSDVIESERARRESTRCMTPAEVLERYSALARDPNTPVAVVKGCLDSIAKIHGLLSDPELQLDRTQLIKQLREGVEQVRKMNPDLLTSAAEQQLN